MDPFQEIAPLTGLIDTVERMASLFTYCVIFYT